MKYGVGIDVSKGKSTVAILSQVGEVMEAPFEIEHTIDGMKKLEDKLSKFSKEALKIVMEETGPYHLPVLGYLLDNNYFVVTENALKIKKYLDRDIRKAKTDRKDSLKLADYACESWHKLTMAKEQDTIYDELKFLSRQYLSKISVQTNLKVDFVNLCDLVFPNFNTLLKCLIIIIWLKKGNTKFEILRSNKTKENIGGKIYEEKSCIIINMFCINDG